MSSHKMREIRPQTKIKMYNVGLTSAARLHVKEKSESGFCFFTGDIQYEGSQKFLEVPMG